MNWKHMTIGKKIGAGFGVVLALLSVVVILGVIGVGGIVKDAGQVIDGNKLDAVLGQKEIDQLNWANKVNALLTDEQVTSLQVETDHHKCAFGQWLYGEGRKQAENRVASLEPLLKAIELPHQMLHESAIEIGKVYRFADERLPTLFAEKEADHLKWAAQIRDAFLNHQQTLDVQTDPHKCALGKWIDSDLAKGIYQNGDNPFKQLWDQMLASHKKLHESAIEIQNALTHSSENAKQTFDQKTAPILEETLHLLEELKRKANHDLEGPKKAKEIYARKTVPNLQKVQSELYGIRKEARKHIMSDEVMLNGAKATQTSVLILGSAAGIIGILLAIMIARSIILVLKSYAEQMSEGAEQIASASGQVSSASQSLAEGASEQAASIEETSSSLEELSSMTKQNADNANQANHLMKETNQTVAQANQSMEALSKSMNDISQASNETQKIIKTIDEIAFQTNLLALNAAVEAARAGEAGAGFAVVADEVRNLAMRAAEAAKNTADMIEGTLIKVKQGSEIVNKTHEAFRKVAQSSTKVGDLITEISTASNEQAQGIEQLNKAVVEMDRGVQQNAANAEESASASEEMYSQCQVTHQIVDELSRLVGVDQKKERIKTKYPVHSNKKDDLKSAAQKRPASTPIKVQKIREINPERIIPLEDDDFKDF